MHACQRDADESDVKQTWRPPGNVEAPSSTGSAWTGCSSRPRARGVGGASTRTGSRRRMGAGGHGEKPCSAVMIGGGGRSGARARRARRGFADHPGDRIDVGLRGRTDGRRYTGRVRTMRARHWWSVEVGRFGSREAGRRRWWYGCRAVVVVPRCQFRRSVLGMEKEAEEAVGGAGGTGRSKTRCCRGGWGDGKGGPLGGVYVGGRSGTCEMARHGWGNPGGARRQLRRGKGGGLDERGVGRGGRDG